MPKKHYWPEDYLDDEDYEDRWTEDTFIEFVDDGPAPDWLISAYEPRDGVVSTILSLRLVFFLLLCIVVGLSVWKLF